MKVEKLQEKYEEIKLLKFKLERLSRENYRLREALENINKRYKLGLDFNRSEILIKQLKQFEKLRNHMADYFPIEHTKEYKFYKEIVEYWTIKDVLDAIKRWARIWK